MAKTRLLIGGRTIEIYDLGQDMNRAFAGLHSAHLGRPVFVWQDFGDEAIQLFNSHPNAWDIHDQYFTNFTVIWQELLAAGSFDAAEKTWEMALEPAFTWEGYNVGQRIHKGTPLYYWAVTALLRGDLDKGYCLMHQAVEEDIASNGAPAYRNCPGFALISLDYAKQDQAFRNWVMGQAVFLDGHLQQYNTAYGRALTLDQVRTRFFQVPPSDDALFLFAYVVARLQQISRIPVHSVQNPFAGQIEINAVFDLVLVIDTAIKPKRGGGRARFIDLAEYVLSRSPRPLTRNQLGELNQSFINDFDRTVDALLNGTFTLPCGALVSDFQRDIALAYGMRNRGGHDVVPSVIVQRRFSAVQQALFNALFGTVEYLY